MTTILKPHQFDTSRSFMDLVWQHSETETIARNIVLISTQQNSEEWTPFTWERYSQLCTHKVGAGERDILEQLVRGNYLDKVGEQYSVTDRFIEAITKYVKR
jgi:hypothetical protein